MTSVPLILIARVLHVVAGILWAGVIFVIVTSVMPLVRQHAQDGAQRWAGMLAQRVGPLSGIAAVVTIVSGVYLMAALHKADDTLAGTVLRIGGLLGVLAFIAGVAVARPAAAKLSALAVSGNDAASQSLRASLQRRSLWSARVTALLVALATICMALFRYAPMLG